MKNSRMATVRPIRQGDSSVKAWPGRGGGTW